MTVAFEDKVTKGRTEVELDMATAAEKDPKVVAAEEAWLGLGLTWMSRVTGFNLSQLNFLTF